MKVFLEHNKSWSHVYFVLNHLEAPHESEIPAAPQENTAQSKTSGYSLLLFKSRCKVSLSNKSRDYYNHLIKTHIAKKDCEQRRIYYSRNMDDVTFSKLIENVDDFILWDQIPIPQMDEYMKKELEKDLPEWDAHDNKNQSQITLKHFALQGTETAYN